MTRGALAALALLALSCGPDHGSAYERALAEGERAQTAGRFADAAARYDAAASSAKVARDRVYARYLAALALERAGRIDEAATRLETLAGETPPSEYAASAAYKEADLHLRSGDAARGYRELDAMLRRFPNDGFARPALHRSLAERDETEGDEKTLAWLRANEATFAKTERAEEFAYEAAVRLARLGRKEAARDAFLDVATRWPYPVGALFDNALYRASEIDEALGRYDDAVRDLERMLAERESSAIMGSYERPKYDQAAMRIAFLYRDRLHDHDRARQAFHRLYADFTTSVLRDRALYREAELWRDDGQPGVACERLSALTRDFPDSRYVPCAEARCPTVRRPAQSKAPAACHAYIERADPGLEPSAR